MNNVQLRQMKIIETRRSTVGNNLTLFIQWLSVSRGWSLDINYTRNVNKRITVRKEKGGRDRKRVV